MPPTPQGSPPTSLLRRALGRSLEEFLALPAGGRARAARDAVSDLHAFVGGAAPFGERDAPARSRELAAALHGALGGTAAPPGTAERIVTDAVLRTECDRDQNVYLGRLFTRRLTRAVPDVVFLPRDAGELAKALRWARGAGVPATLRGAASTAMGGAVPAEGGLVLDLAGLDAIAIDPERHRVRIGAGTRLRPLHAALRARGLALPVYPSNLGGTYAGWLATGGIGMNAYGAGRALDAVVEAELVRPDGSRLRLGRDAGPGPLQLADLAGTEGQLGAVVELELELVPLPMLAAFLLGFERREDALAAVAWIGVESGQAFPAPSDVKLLSASHLEHARAVWREEDGKPWRRVPEALSHERELPWDDVVGPAALGAETEREPCAPRHQPGSRSQLTAPKPDSVDPAAWLFVDFAGEEAGRAFAARLGACPGRPRVPEGESVRFARDRFRPQQIKRLGPGYLAAEILLPADRVGDFLPRAERLARDAGTELDAEVYYLADGTALAIAGFLTDHRRGSFQVDLLLAPALLDLAIARCGGRPYVLGRWQANLLARKLGAQERARLAGLKRELDPARIVNRGAFFSMGLRTPLGWALELGIGPAVRAARLLVGWAPPVAALARRALRRLPGPAAGRGAALGEAPLEAGAYPEPPVAATARALHCVNCGECNSVCPIFHESQVRLPQMLTHLGEAQHAGEGVGPTGSALLDLCMRCGNCEEVCQAGIPHLPLYGALQSASDAERPRDRERHVLLLEHLRASPRYTRDFLDVRPGGYLARTPASLPGSARFLLLRAEAEAGPAETCIHCGACVDVCPTEANHVLRADDPRLVTTTQERCIGCGTCVEVCPANLRNGGRTLRVMEAPTLDWVEAARAFADREATAAAQGNPEA